METALISIGIFLGVFALAMYILTVIGIKNNKNQ